MSRRHQTRASGEETTITMAYLDRTGAEQFAVLRSTALHSDVRANAGTLRQAIDAYYEAIGCQLLTVQVSYEESHILAGTRPRPLLKLVQGGMCKFGLLAILCASLAGSGCIKKTCKRVISQGRVARAVYRA